jgi:2'-5' RNA ligase
VIWVGLEGDTETAGRLKSALDQALKPLGWEPEGRAFRPHLTLGRVKQQQRAIDLPWGTPVVPASWTVQAIHLFESELRPEGSLYTIRHTGHLQGPAG